MPSTIRSVVRCRARMGLLMLLSAGAAVPGALAMPERAAYVVDFTSQTLDRVDLETGAVQLGLVPVGAVPNQVRVFDQTAFVVNSIPENLQIIELATMTSELVALPPGSTPWAVEVVAGTAYVSLFGADQVAVIDLQALAVVDLIKVGRAPEGLCVAGGRLFVANSGFAGPGVYEPGTLTVIDTATNQVVDSIELALNPQWCAVDREGEINVVCSGEFGASAGQLQVVDPAAGAVVDSVRVGGFPGPVAISSTGIAYMVEYEAGLLAVDTTANLALNDIDDPIPVGGLGALGLAIDGLNRVCVAVSFDGLLTVIDPGGTIAAAYAVGPTPQDVDVLELQATPVELVSLEAHRAGQTVVLEWRTRGTLETVGFHVERRDDASGGRFVRQTDDPVREIETLEDDRTYRWIDAAPCGGPADYRLIAVDASGGVVHFGPFRVDAAIPALHRFAAHPNPVTRTSNARLRVEIGAPGAVEVEIIDVAGRSVRLLYRGPLAAGRHDFQWDGRTSRGAMVAAGTYFARLVGPTFTHVTKVVVIDP